ncbi:hypothetical protein [Thaumasiovibrio subtropicus]|uniref:hypothetical protein n=1 Tax=Thaumasiovibrio subtropicus TaxID=1891207 RepID=UPI000B3537D4|nr:hypothetical protein [Thaumasiovibrio subtropicus]
MSETHLEQAKRQLFRYLMPESLLWEDDPHSRHVEESIDKLVDRQVAICVGCDNPQVHYNLEQSLWRMTQLEEKRNAFFTIE